MYIAKSPHVNLALESIIAIVSKQDVGVIQLRPVPEEMNEKLACFVSIHMLDGSLRGCIGTIEPREKNLFLEIIGNAVSAATRDSRFSPVVKSELEKMVVSVDVLSKPFQIENIELLNPEKYGVIVTDGGYLRGVLLPNIEGVETVEKQLNIARRKAGLSDYSLEKLKIFAFTSTRYH